MRILLTGSSGYIGRYLASLLKQAGHSVIGFDRDSDPSVPLDEFIHADLIEPGRYVGALKTVDHICHLAAARGDWGIPKEEYYRDNLEATRALLEAARRAGVKRWMFYSTVSALGPSEVPLSEEAPRRPINAYGGSKADCEALFDRYVSEEPNANVITIRPSVVFGPGNPENTNIFRLIDAIYRNRFVMVGRGQEVKTTSHLDNLLDAHMFLMERQLRDGGQGHELYHYVDTPGETTASLVAHIHRLLGKRAPRLRLPLAIASPVAVVGDMAAAVTGMDLPITSARVRKFCTATNFSAERIRGLGYKQRVSNGTALARTVRWYLESYLPNRAA